MENDALKKLKKDFEQEDNKVKIIENKKRATIMYRRRKLDKDVRQYTSKTKRINSGDIGRIGDDHGFHIRATPLRESRAPREDA